MDTNDNKTYSVSVVIPAYNAEKFIERTVNSVLAQTLPPDEIIVVDDGSTDRTAEVARSFGNKIRYIHQRNQGVSVARNTGIEAAKSQWIALLDADDEWLAEKLQQQINLLKRNPELMWAGSNHMSFLSSSNRKAPRNNIAKTKKLMGDKDYWDDYFTAFAAGVWGWTGTMIVKRCALEEAGMFIAGQLRANDVDMWLRLADIYPAFGYICQPLAVYYLEIENSICRKHAFLEWQEEFISRHLKIAKEHGRLEAFEPCVTYMLRSWTRSMLFEARAKEIRALLSRFGHFLPIHYRFSMWALTIFPRITQRGCLMISQIVRSLNLRRQVVRKPNRPC